MKIKKITLKNGYKRFKDTTIDLGENPKRIVTLIGPNGSGKSSVFDGMLYSHNLLKQIGRFDMKDSSFHSDNQYPNFNINSLNNVIITFDSGEFRKVFNQKQATDNTVFAFRSPHRYFSNLNVETLTKIPNIAENNFGASSTIDLDDKITQNYQRLYSLVDKKYKENGETGYNKIKRQVIGELNTSLQYVLDLEIKDHGDIQAGQGTLFFTKTDQKKPFNFNVLSSGEKEVVDILLDIFLKKTVFTDTVYIIDEPELHINTNIQGKLLQAVLKMIPESCQLWIATHSIGFLNALKKDYNDDSDIILFEGNFGTEKVCLKPMLKTRSNWKKVFHTALEDLTELLAPNCIIFCEGDPNGNTNKNFDAQVYGKIFKDTYPDAQFVSIGSSNEIANIENASVKIVKNIFTFSKIIKFIDRDDKSKQEVEELLRNEIKTSSKRHIESYLWDDELIKKLCFSVGSDKLSDCLTAKKNAIKDSVSRGNPLDDIKSANGDIFIKIKKILNLTQCGDDQFAFLRDTMTPLITEDTKIYQELKKEIFG